jgi:hypothetical protein
MFQWQRFEFLAAFSSPRWADISGCATASVDDIFGATSEFLPSFLLLRTWLSNITRCATASIDYIFGAASGILASFSSLALTAQVSCATASIDYVFHTASEFLPSVREWQLKNTNG